MKKFLSLLLCAVALCGFCSNANAMICMRSSINEEDKFATREDLEDLYLKTMGRKLSDEFICSDDGELIVSKGVSNPDYALYYNRLAEIKKRTKEMLPQSEDYIIPLIIIGDNEPDLARLFELDKEDTSNYSLKFGCVAMWEDGFNKSYSVKYGCLDYTAAVLTQEMNGHVPRWINRLFHWEFAVWICEKGYSQEINDIIYGIKNEAYKSTYELYHAHEDAKVWKPIIKELRRYAKYDGLPRDNYIIAVFGPQALDRGCCM